MFEQLAAHRRILVTGPQRSGTTIASQMIALDTGHRCIDESEFGVYDVAAWRALLQLDDVVIQCPHMLKFILDDPREDVLVVLMRRDLAAIHASERRIRWEEIHRGNSAELAAFGLAEGSSAEIKYAYWAASARPPHYLELHYDTLREHPLYVPTEGRVSFGRKETRPMAAPGPLDNGWREWMAGCAMLGIGDDHIRRRSDESGQLLPEVAAELDEIRQHPYVRAGERLGYRVRKLEAILEAARTVARTSSAPIVVDCRRDLTPATFVGEYFARNRPVRLDGLTQHWPARRWTPESLVGRLGPALVRATAAPDPGDGPELAHRVLMSAYLEAITGRRPSGHEYLDLDPQVLVGSDAGDVLSELSPRPPFLAAEGSAGAALWLGPPGIVTTLHIDVVNVLLVQLAGRSLVRLYPPEETPLLYNTSGAVSEVDPEAPDLTRHPAFAECRPIAVDLAAGQALFVPVTWWHHIRSVDVGVRLSFSRFTAGNDFPALRRVVAERPGDQPDRLGRDRCVP
jgi:hypothetical protein